jgi:isopenicillin N synthase-like dioxygenase
MSQHAIPSIDFSVFEAEKQAIAKQISAACLEHGFFYIAGAWRF